MNRLVTILCMVSLVQVLYEQQGGLPPSKWTISREVCEAFLLSVQKFAIPDFDGHAIDRVRAQLRRWLMLLMPILPNMMLLAGMDAAADWTLIAAKYKKPFQRARVWQVLIEVRRWLTQG
jgi:hypothetical protein